MAEGGDSHMNYGELKQTIADYAHRADLSSQIPGFIRVATARLNRDLRVQEMVTELATTPTTNPWALPDDYLELRELTRDATNSVGRVQLSSVSNHQINKYAGATGSPTFYSIDGFEIETAPGGLDTEYALQYVAALPELVGDADTNAVLTRYPNLYIYGALIELYSWTQDQANQQRVTEMVVSEIAAANASSAWAEAGESPQLAGASAWV